MSSIKRRLQLAALLAGSVFPGPQLFAKGRGGGRSSGTSAGHGGVSAGVSAGGVSAAVGVGQGGVSAGVKAGAGGEEEWL